MKSLQNRYNLIKEGKGNKETFLKEVKAQFPQYITNVQTFDQVIHSLTEKGIINESIVLVSANRPETQDWFKIFQENTESVKAELKDTDKSVTEKETAGYNYEDKKNSNNISTAQMLEGYYAEMRDPKNADKTEDQIKAIVFKNLEKDPLFYVKNAAFGIKGIGYSDNHPGLGPTKEVTGKYKSSGMEPVKLNESKHSSEADLKIYKSELNMLNKIKPTGEKQLKRKAELEKKIADLEKKVTSSLKEGEEEMYVVYSYPDGKEDQKELYRKDNSLRDAKLRAGNLNIMFKEDSDIYSYMKQSEWEAQYGPLSEDKATLSEAKKRAIEKHIKEIEKMGEVAAWEHRINMIQEKIEELTNKMTVTEGDDVKDMVDKKAVKELKKDIALLEKKKALYEKQKAKAGKRITDKSAMQTAAGEGATVMEKEEKPHTPPTDPDREKVFASMKRDTAPKPKKESWSGMVRELINTKNLKVK